MKKLVKILPILMMVLIVLTACTPVYASGLTIGGQPVNPTDEIASQTGIGNVANNIFGIIQVIGTIVAVGVLMVIGIKYMMGSAEEKAEYKKTMIPYLVGAIILFAAVNIAGVVVNMANAITTTTTGG